MNAIQRTLVGVLLCTLIVVGVVGAIFVAVANASSVRCSSPFPTSLNASGSLPSSNLGAQAVAAAQLYSVAGVVSSLSGPGAVFVYRRLSVDAAPQLVSSIADPEPDSTEFGSALVLDESAATLVVGAPLASSVYVYHRSPRNASLFVFSELLTGNIQTERFGSSLALVNNSLVVGVPSARAVFGAVDVFERPNSSALFGARRQRIESPVANARFGFDVALCANGRALLVGSPSFSSDEGLANLFNRSSVAEPFVAALALIARVAGTSENATLGASVALNSDASLAAVGAPKHFASVPGVRSGAVALFSLRNGGTLAAPLLVGAEQFAQFGFDVALSTLGSRQLFLVVSSYSDGEVAGDALLFVREKNAFVAPFFSTPNRSQIGRSVAFGQRALVSSADRLDDGALRIATQACLAVGS